MLVGDAARQVSPLTGGGIANAVEAAKLAPKVATDAIRDRDCSAARLRRYQDA